ncbi:hypothetical protein LNJ05_12095 [Tenacibaculum finnmarkense genomovar ulcerans]|uniref:hypothetical protein n=1 Tax=Tenacibaculum finnmarkense TaxID=2781243 RepID=UPI00187BC0E6|nr:hypothetical protein [Tenacibaculum finnmarkense]MBE7635092.1 hypothetical protein [Tenacibaculum finnmarkense genomovar ulcerans]MCD8401317.1 hypothetical protein [Tenacibaculum finnmarkense genomovar ulcerans]MCD8403857.1 hypothetical protein [Tenacibaculum finnmarkense genomovar finnmarkense]MCD8431026.1 hypothetical protein [Tenacibaculum finnmarkense genomovar ulcerans]MCD8433502.1 hypothetical protein [Tenacibaculum finnmarkense genomovar ulcerans]
MSQYNRTYIIQLHDTLQTVADTYGYTSLDLQTYHNTFCDLDKRIVMGINRLNEVILPPLGRSLENGVLIPLKGKQKEVDFYYNKSVNNNISRLNNNYGIIIKEQNNGSAIKRRNYTVNMMFKEISKSNLYTIELNKTQTYIDYKEPTLLAETLAQKLGEPLFPVKIGVDKKGEFVAVLNQELVFEKWKNTKEAIEQYYKSAFVTNLINKTEAAYRNKNKIKKALLQNIFFTFYFSGIYTAYGNKLAFQKKMNIPLYPFYKEVEYTVIQSVEPYLNSIGKIVIHQKGYVSDKRTSEDIKQKKDYPFYNDAVPLEGELQITYFLEPKTHIITSIVGYITLYLNKRIERKIKIEGYLLKK